LLRKATIALAIMGLLLGGCAADRRSGKVYGKPPQPRKVSVADLETFGTEGRWSTSIIGGRVAGLYPLGDIICAYTEAHRLIALDSKRGVELWRLILPADLQFGPYRHGDVVYFSLQDTVYGMDAKTGEELWKKSVEVPLSSPPTLFAGKIMAGSTTGILGAWPVYGKKLAWSILQCRTTEKPVVSGSVVYVPATDGLLRAVNVATGEPVWAYPTERDFVTSPVLLPGGLVIGTEEGGVYRLSEDGERLWLTVLKRPVKKVWADGELVIAMTSPVGAVMVDAETSEELRTVAGAVKVAGISDRIACLLTRGELVALDRTNYEEAWRLPLGEFSVVAQNAKSNELYVATRQGVLAALELK